MKFEDKIKYLQNNHFVKYINTYNELKYKYIDESPIFCICGKLGTGLHLSNCRKVDKHIKTLVVKELKDLIPEN